MIVRALATWRLTELVVDDEIARPLRDWVDQHAAGTPLHYLVHCRRCVSVWAALAVGLAPRRICRALAVSALTILLSDQLDQQAARLGAERMRNASVGVPPG